MLSTASRLAASATHLEEARTELGMTTTKPKPRGRNRTNEGGN